MTVTDGLKLLVVLLKFVFIDLNAVALKGAQKLSVEIRRCWSKLFIDDFFDFSGPGDYDGNLLILDELEFFGGGAVVEEEGKVFFASVFEIGEYILTIPARFLLVKIFMEVGLDGSCGKRIIDVEVEDFVADVGSLGEVSFGSSVF